MLDLRNRYVTGMAQLRDRVAEVAALLPRGKPVVYLDYPVHTNIGDLLIEKGTETFFAELGYEVVDQRSAHDFGARAMRRIPADATIVLHGGGNFGDLYDLHQPFREHVIKSLPNHRIVILPQTMHFASRARLEAAAAAFARHPDLHVCLRDTSSLEIYRRHFANPAYLIPDMAHFLWGGERPVPARGGGTLFIVRRDREGVDLGDAVPEGLPTKDWPDIIPDTLTFRVLRRILVNHPGVSGRIPVYRAWQWYVGELVQQTFAAMAGYDTVVTNRLHGALFGLLLGKPVTMLDNCYGKLSSYYDTWLTGIDSVELNVAAAEQPPERLRRRLMAVEG